MKHFYPILNNLSLNFLTFMSILFLSSLLINFEGPSYAHNFLSKNTSQAEIELIQSNLGHQPQSFIQCFKRVKDLLTLNPGYSEFHKSPVTHLLEKAIPATISVTLPSFIIGIFLALLIAILTCYDYRLPNKLVDLITSLVNSLSCITLIVLAQIFFCTKTGLGFFPVQGWNIYNFLSYLQYASVPIFILSTNLGCYYAPLFQAALIKEKDSLHTMTLRAMGCSRTRIIIVYNLKKCLVPILSHITRSFPYYVLGGNLIIENYFNIPGLGLLAYQSCIAGDDKTLLAIIGIISFCYLSLQSITTIAIKIIDPRIQTN